MALNKSEVEYVENYIERTGTNYIDVQMEVLDHVASAVEDIKDRDGAIDVKDAVQEVHKSFGIFGFDGFVNDVIHGMNEKYTKLFWSNFRSFLSLKYFPILIIAVVLFYKIQVLVNNPNTIFAFSTICMLSFTGIKITMNSINKPYRRFLAYKVSNSYLAYISLFFMIFNLLLKWVANVEYLKVNIQFLLAAVMLVLFIVYIVSGIKTANFGKKASQLLMEKYRMLLT